MSDKKLMSKLELIQKLKRQERLIKLCSWSLFVSVLLAWLIFGIWVLNKKKKKNDLVEKIFCRLLIFTLLFSLLAGIVFASLWSVWNTGLELVKLL